MPRGSRMLSESSIYHIVLKGHNAEQIFFDDDDYRLFLKMFKSCCDDYDVEILAYCLMNNHIHLLLKYNDSNMSNLFKSFGAGFVFVYNKKYNRSGSLFNGRYYSKAINDDNYLLAVLRYIHFNPVKAKICEHPLQYKWSSYEEYDFGKSTIANIQFINDLINREQFLQLHRIDKNDYVDNFIISRNIDLPNDSEINEFLEYVKEHYNIAEAMEICKKARIDKKKVYSYFAITRSKYDKLTK